MRIFGTVKLGIRTHRLTRIFSTIKRKCISSYVFPKALSGEFNGYVNRHLKYANPYDSDQKALAVHGGPLVNMFAVPSHLRKMFYTAAAPAVTILHNVPVDTHLPPTPTDDATPKNKGYTSEYALRTLAMSFNIKFRINTNEKNGELFQNVSPQVARKNEISSRGYGVTLNWHTENSHETHPPEFILLHCLRDDKNAKTGFVLLEEILAGLPERIIGILKQPCFKFVAGPSYHKKEEVIAPILENRAGSLELSVRLNLNLNPDRCIPLTSEATEAYHYLKNLLKQPALEHSIVLVPGDCLVINNNKALHKRTAFDISTPPNESRWLQRGCGDKDKQQPAFVPSTVGDTVSSSQNRHVFFKHHISAGKAAVEVERLATVIDNARFPINKKFTY